MPMLVCDFCSSTEVTWQYPARSIGSDAMVSAGAWIACAPCHDLIEARDDEGLLTRAIESMGEVFMAPEAARPAVRELFDAFRVARLGRAEPITALA